MKTYGMAIGRRVTIEDEIHLEKSRLYPQKSPIYPQKSPEYPQKSPAKTDNGAEGRK